MTEESKLSGKTLGLKKTLSVKGQVRQQDPRMGRNNIVQVEVRKKRVFSPQEKTGELLSEGASQKIKLVQEALVAAALNKKLKEEEARKQQEAEKQRQEENKVQVIQKEQQNTVVEKKQEKIKEEEKTYSSANKERGAEKETSFKKKQEEKQIKKASTFTERRSSGKININSWGGEDSDDEYENGVRHGRRSLASIKRAREKERLKQQEKLKTAEKISREVVLPETITVQELANRMSEKGVTVVKELMKMGMMVTITQTIDADTAQLVAEELGHHVKRVAASDVEDVLKHEESDPKNLRSRPPVVTVMGHVDHGKTSLLDALRSTHVAAGESGGITQHIGAYQVRLSSGEKVTFIDTPGHAAFTEMRARGAKITDLVVLVVAANDSVMPQTIEAINHAKAAQVPVVVAINKIDAVGANPEKVKTDLLQHEVIVESMGGDVLSVEVSAKQRLNLDKLVEAILLQAEVLDLKADSTLKAEGAVVEAKMDKGRGPVATILIQKGTLRIGDIFVSGQEWGRVRSLFNDKGERVKQALPAEPVEVIGLQGTPKAGDDFIVVDSESQAREISAYRQCKAREALQVKRLKGAEQLFAQIKAGEVKELPVVIKGDVQGSVEAICSQLSKLVNNEVKVSVLHSAVGGINETDISLARASHAMVIGFNVRANPNARELARRDGVDIRYYSIIYDVIDDVKKALEGLLTPELREKILGYAEVRQVISISKVGKVAGCMVKEGLVRRGAKVRILRDDTVIYSGPLSQLKHFKDDVKEVKEGFECGISFDNTNDIKVSDVIECYEMEEIAVHLNM